MRQSATIPPPSTTPEQILFYRLCEAMPNMQIFAQVGVAQLAHCVVARKPDA